MIEIMTETMTLYKLIILYLLQKVDFALNTSQLAEFILDKGYTTYFALQKALSELLEDGFLSAESTHQHTFYRLTQSGEQTIEYFRSRLSPAIKQDVKDFLKEKEYALREEASVKSKYYKNTEQEYDVICQILEDGMNLMELKLTVPTQSEAESIADNWPKYNQEIYSLLMSKLL